jgi:hypothetical protein
MNYTYEILKLEPNNEFISVKYSCEGKNDYFYNAKIIAFGDSDIQTMIDNGANLAGEYWNRVDSHPETTSFATTGSGTWTAPAPVVETTVADTPDINFDTQSAELSDTPDENGVLQWTVTTLPESDVATNIRRRRTDLLEETDWMLLSDSPTPSQAWLDYRQALRDIPDQSGFPMSVTWPTKPA